MTCPAPWHVEPISVDDDARLKRLMKAFESETGEHSTKSGTLRRLVRDAVRRLPDPEGDQGA